MADIHTTLSNAAGTAPDAGRLEQELATAWPFLTVQHRELILELVHQFAAVDKILQEALEEAEAIKAYDAAKAAQDEVIPFEQALKEIGYSRE
jgi:hypothetical protein